MRSRALQLLMVVYWGVWALLIVPAHTRGAMAASGARAEGAGKVSMFFDVMPSCCQNKPGKGPVRSSADCAVCKVVAHTVVVPIVPVGEARMGLLGWVAADGGTGQKGAQCQWQRRSRAPPVG